MNAKDREELLKAYHTLSELFRKANEHGDKVGPMVEKAYQVGRQVGIYWERDPATVADVTQEAMTTCLKNLPSPEQD